MRTIETARKQHACVILITLILSAYTYLRSCGNSITVAKENNMIKYVLKLNTIFT